MFQEGLNQSLVAVLLQATTGYVAQCSLPGHLTARFALSVKGMGWSTRF